MDSPKPRWKQIEEAREAHIESFNALSTAIRDKASTATLDGLRREWGKAYDHYAALRDGPWTRDPNCAPI